MFICGYDHFKNGYHSFIGTTFPLWLLYKKENWNASIHIGNSLQLMSETRQEKAMRSFLFLFCTSGRSWKNYSEMKYKLYYTTGLWLFKDFMRKWKKHFPFELPFTTTLWAMMIWFQRYNFYISAAFNRLQTTETKITINSIYLLHFMMSQIL